MLFRVSILQLAVHDKVFIIDLFNLYLIHSAEDMLKIFFHRFFTSADVIKIGKNFCHKCKAKMFRPCENNNSSSSWEDCSTFCSIILVEEILKISSCCCLTSFIYDIETKSPGPKFVPTFPNHSNHSLAWL